MKIIIEEFIDYQAIELSKLIQRNLLEINSQYYPIDTISYLLNEFTAENIINNSKIQHIYVASINNEIIGTGGLANFGNKVEPMFFGVAFFIKPELHRKGIGKQILRRVEEKAKEMGGNKLIIRAARGSEEFYKKQGYIFRKQKTGKANIESEEMEKVL